MKDFTTIRIYFEYGQKVKDHSFLEKALFFRFFYRTDEKGKSFWIAPGFAPKC